MKINRLSFYNLRPRALARRLRQGGAGREARGRDRGQRRETQAVLGRGEPWRLALTEAVHAGWPHQKGARRPRRTETLGPLMSHRGEQLPFSGRVVVSATPDSARASGARRRPGVTRPSVTRTAPTKLAREPSVSARPDSASSL